MSSLFDNTPAHTILFPSSLWISFKALPPPTSLAYKQCTRHVCTLPLLLQGIHIIFNICVYFPVILTSSPLLLVLSHLQWHACISACLPSSIAIKIKVIPAVLTLRALWQTNWPVNEVVANVKCWICCSLSSIFDPHFEISVGTLEWSYSISMSKMSCNTTNWISAKLGGMNAFHSFFFTRLTHREKAHTLHAIRHTTVHVYTET